ncbi:Sulfurtransferase TusA [Marinomonas spartinae]|uniref:Sulfurtransferase TusA n=1 Tax=Marinomonas spartinae TaxID=1792290 RepID=A0A1A8TM47_9GAMM|nr:sulfurtransferase TusA [Marinomonas spartinae]SBS33915.1 Sulfurtransferase TusA [Marinomonas spartinae]SBS37993.1 Sulfurtransferase TusA [Marinomonas spartinae]
MEHHSLLDASGLMCPEPVMMLHVEIKKIEPLEVLKVIATDPSTTRDIPKFCRFLGHTLVKQEQEGDVYYYWIQKREK